MDKTTEKLGATEEIFPEIQGDYKFWKEVYYHGEIRVAIDEIVGHD